MLAFLTRKPVEANKQYACELFAKGLFADTSLGYTLTVQVNAETVYKEKECFNALPTEKQGKIAITQPIHASVSGQLARRALWKRKLLI